MVSYVIKLFKMSIKEMKADFFDDLTGKIIELNSGW